MTIEDISIRRLGEAQIARIEIPVFIKHFPMTQGDFLAGSPLNLHLRPPGQVLGKINDPLSIGCDRIPGRRQSHQAADGFVFLGNEVIERTVEQFSVADGLRFEDGILRFAVIDLGKADGADGNEPAFICADRFLRPILVGEDQHCQQRCGVAIMIWCRHKAQGTFIPAFTQGEAQFVFAQAKAVHGIGLVLQPLVIAGPAGGKIGIIHLFAVDFSFVQPVGGGVQPGFLQGLFHREGFGKARAGSFFLGQAMSDPPGAALKSLAGKQARFKMGGGRGGFSFACPYGDFPLVFRTGRKCGAGIIDQDALIAFHPACVPPVPSIGHFDLISGLPGVHPVALQLPAETGMLFIHSQRRGFIFYGQIVQFQHNGLQFL